MLSESPEGPTQLAMARTMINRLVGGIESIATMDDKVMAIREGLLLMGIPWDPDEGRFWTELIEHVQDGGELTDAYLVDWRRRYQDGLGIGGF